MTESPYPGPHIQVDLDTWAQRIESKLDRYHEDMQRQIIELQRKPEPIKDGEHRVHTLEVRVAEMARDVEDCNKFRQEAAVTKKLMAKGWAVAGGVGALAAPLFNAIQGALR